MIDRIYGTQKIHGKYIGALNSTNELAIFTDHAPDYGYCISMKDADPENDRCGAGVNVATAIRACISR